MQPPFGLVLCDRSPHQTSDMRLMDWLTLSSGTNASRDTHGDGAAFNRSGSARSARNSSPPHYDTDPKPAVPSLNDEPGCIKVVDTFRKPGALRNGAPFKGWVLPGAIGRLRQKLRSVEDGDRQMVKILTAVLADGMPAVEAACAEALNAGLCSSDVVLNALSRQRQPVLPPSIPVPQALVLRHAPVADCARYDILRRLHYGTP